MSISSNYSDLLSGGYYQLNQQNGAADSVGAASSTTDTSVATANSNAAATSAFLLSLSPEAQDYLNGIGLTGSTSSSTASSSNSFTLTQNQQQTLNSIIQKYAGQPFTQDTFNSLQGDLEKAGLSPDQLVQQAKINAFNPTTELLSALNGDNLTDSNGDQTIQSLNALNGTAQYNATDPNSQSAANAQYDTQKNNYIQQITEALQKVAAPEAS